MGGVWGGRKRRGKEGRGKGQRTRITIISIRLRLSLCNFEIALVGHLVEGVFAAAEEFAGVAVAVIHIKRLAGLFFLDTR